MERKELVGALFQEALDSLIAEIRQGIEEDVAEVEAEFGQLIKLAKESGKYTQLVDYLIEVTDQCVAGYGEKAHEPLRALVEHMLTECPEAREGFAERLALEYPELAPVLLAPASVECCGKDEHG